jgi:glucose-1-phosphate thymidylyltransferase
MKAIILSAGYATRLYPLTLNAAKPLIDVGGKKLIDYLLYDLDKSGDIDEIFVVVNQKFFGNFEKWLAEIENKISKKISLVNDGSIDESTKLGAVGDINYVTENKKINDDILVVAGDNLFSDSFLPFISFCKKQNAPILGTYDVGDLELVKKMSVINTNKSGQIVHFEEKPKEPISTMIGIALYFYPKHSIEMIRRYIKEGNNPDQPGRLIEWFYKKTPVFTWAVPGTWFDVGSHESLKLAEDFLRNKN